MTKLLPALFLVMPMLGSCSGGNYLMERLERLEDGQWLNDGEGCIFVGKGGDVSGGGLETTMEDPGVALSDDYFSLYTVATKGKATVTITTAIDNIEMVFDNKFLHSDEERVTEITTVSGIEYRVIHWGAFECEMSDTDDIGKPVDGSPSDDSGDPDEPSTSTGQTQE